MVKRCNDGKITNRYTFDDDDPVPTASHAPPPVVTQRHRHVDYCYKRSRPSMQTSYFDTQEVSSNRPCHHVTEDEQLVPHEDHDEVDLLTFIDPLDDLEGLPRRRRRTAGDRPLQQWLPYIDCYLAELLRLEGRGDFRDSHCARCGDVMAPYRCEDCHTVAMFCTNCLLETHTSLPLHRISEWSQSESFFRSVTLKSLGLRIQLGHEPGDHCHNPKKAFADDFVVLDISGIHPVAVDFCGCQSALPHVAQLLRSRWYPATCTDPKTAATFGLLQNFHLLSTQSKVSAHEFYTALSRRTENTGIHPPKSRYAAFLTMAREWRHLKMLKRSGRGHDPEGVNTTVPGSCVVECPACPHPKKNLPRDWQNAPAEKRWLYRLFVAMDANFRLKRKKVSSDKVDPGLNHGYAYFVEEKAYKVFLQQHSDMPTEKHTHCNNHDAVKLANKKNGVHLAATGVGAVDCARHGMKRPSSVGDLQKGERYVNMDYLLHNSLLHSPVLSVVGSYDIACQYGLNVLTRFKTYGFDTLGGSRALRWAVPNFHIAAHQDYCRGQYSLHYIPECGHYDAESIERGWSMTNPAAASTKEMGPGSRRDFLDDIFSDHNWHKVTKLPSFLLEKIKVAVPERERHVVSFDEYNAALPPDQVAEWKVAVEAWEADPTKPNPFLCERPDITESAIRKKLLEEDGEALRLGTAVVLHEDFSSSTMLAAGLDLEDQQRRHSTDLAALHEHATDLAQSKLLEKQNTLHRKLEAWFKVQQLFMPGVTVCRAQMMANPTSQLPHKIPLLLPSAATQYLPCDSHLLEQEWLLREAQAHDALVTIRCLLELRCHLYRIKDRFVRGQGPNTRAMTSISTVQAKIDLSARRYRDAHAALSILSPRLEKDEQGWRAILRTLNDTDLRHVSDAGEGEASETTRTLSWIWKSSGLSANDASLGGDSTQQSLQESLRVEWCKARARANRWKEECDLLVEEMRRVIAYHGWAGHQWDERIAKVFLDQPDYLEGANAYARRQGDIRHRMKSFCKHAWRYVKVWMCLGKVPNQGAHDDVASETGSMPDLESIAEFNDDETSVYEDHNVAGEAGSMPGLEAIAELSDHDTSIHAAISARGVDSETGSMPDLESVAY